MNTPKSYIAYVGCYSSLEGGIHCLEITPENGTIRHLGVTRGIADPTFVILNKARTKLYAGVCQVKGQKNSGGAASFDIAADYSLTCTSLQPSGGTKPCHVALDDDEKTLFAANYGEGSCACFKLDGKGDVLPAFARFSHSGHGPHPIRQTSPHVHFATVTPDQELVYFVDLGLDTVKAYRYGNGKGNLAPVPEADIHTAPGAGPRHLAFTGNGRRAYVINEVDSTVDFYLRDGIAYCRQQSLSLLPQGYPKADQNTASAIKLTPDGTRLLCSNRGYDSIAVFDVDRATGALTLLAINPTMGRGPRDFAILPDGKTVIVAHQYTDNVLMFSLNQDGTLTHFGNQVLVPQGVCFAIV